MEPQNKPMEKSLSDENANPFGQNRRVNTLAIPLILGGYLLMWRVITWLDAVRIVALLSPLLALISMGLTLWFASQVGLHSSRSRSTAVKLMLTALLGAAWIILGKIGVAPVRIVEYYLPGTANLMLIWFAAGIGGALSYLLSGINLILPVSIALAAVDIWTVLLGGPVQKALQSPSPAAHAVRHTLLVKTAPPLPIFQNLPSIGFADYLFIAFFVAAICRFTPSEKTYPLTVRTMILTLCGYMCVTFFVNVNLPALVPMAVVMIGLHWKGFHYTRSEAFALLYAALVVLLICLLFRLGHVG